LKFLILAIIVIISASGIISVNGILLGDGKKESDVILVGKVVSFEENIPKQETDYLVDVEEYLKVPNGFDTNARTVTITSPGLPKHPDLAYSVIYDKTYESGDRVLFLLHYKDGKLEESLYSQTTKSDCSPKQLLDQMYGPAGFSITQNNQTNHLYTNKPVDLTFYVYNIDLKSEKKDFEFEVFTPSGKISEKRYVQMQECKRSSKVSWSFVPTVPGKYTFSATLSPNPAGGESISGILIEDYVDPPLKQYKKEGRDGIKCATGLEILHKASNGFPACIKPTTKTELLKRGWGSETWPFKSVIQIDNPSIICAQNGGHWLDQYKECEYVSAKTCSLIDGQYDEKSNCRHNHSSEWCTGEGVPVCTINDMPINNTKMQKEITILSISPQNVTLPEHKNQTYKTTCSHGGCFTPE